MFIHLDKDDFIAGAGAVKQRLDAGVGAQGVFRRADDEKRHETGHLERIAKGALLRRERAEGEEAQNPTAARRISDARLHRGVDRRKSSVASPGQKACAALQRRRLHR
ncbi:hypothetical protein [Caldilinea sp.]|uniref:hypothetical protein n=1 Tax=Caldilinea sp. TaxID=2293560 RepID=UPI0035B55572